MATGVWSISTDVRRRGTSALLYDPATDTFAWPYTGETVSELANDTVVNVDVATGTTATGPALPRRTVVSQEKCELCHKRLALHGGSRTSIPECLFCHAPDRTDWNRRPKITGGTNVFLAGTLDGLEERSVDLKTMIHRIHTGGRRGLAQIDPEPFVIYGNGNTANFFDGNFPNDLANCRVCHEGESFLPENILAGASPTIANENPTLLHDGTAVHPAGEPSVLPITSACTSCHDTVMAKYHVPKHTVGTVEGCVACHGASGSKSVYATHNVAPP
jgi:OmcA/MtrC family decaheme c-type cytochrome